MRFWDPWSGQNPEGSDDPCGRAANSYSLAVSELIFEVTEDHVDGGYCASALGVGIHTQGDTVEELRANVREAVDCFFDDRMEAPRIIRLHFVRDEIMSR